MEYLIKNAVTYFIPNLKSKLLRLKSYIICRLKENEFPLQELADVIVHEKDLFVIPGVCYQTWEDNRFGRTHMAEIKKFRDLNPGISWILFDNKQREDYMRTFWINHPIYQVFQRSKFGVIKADIFRYCILFERGGYYFDISKGCTTPLRDLHSPESEALIAFEQNLHDFEIDDATADLLMYPQNLIGQWSFGFAQGHPFLKNVIDLIVKNSSSFEGVLFEDPKVAVWEFTGPRAFTRAVHSSINPELFKTTTQSGIDYNRTGIFQLTGAHVRHFTRSHYWNYKNRTILRDRG
jgi:mannosyltransferase OCH1-like enzyme